MITAIRIFCLMLFAGYIKLLWEAGFPDLVWNWKLMPLAAATIFTGLTAIFNPRPSRGKDWRKKEDGEESREEETVKRYRRTLYGWFVILTLVTSIAWPLIELFSASHLTTENMLSWSLLACTALAAHLLTKATAIGYCDFCYNEWTQISGTKEPGQPRVFFCDEDV